MKREFSAPWPCQHPERWPSREQVMRAKAERLADEAQRDAELMADYEEYSAYVLAFIEKHGVSPASSFTDWRRAKERR